jgi:hypothetical protein
MEKNKMNLLNVRNTDQAFKTTRYLAIIFGVILLIAFIFCIVYFSNKIDEAYTKSYIFDNTGKVYTTGTVDTKEMRGFEYENHVKTFFLKWYSFDEGTYDGNIKEALELIGDKGKELLNEYNDVNILNTMIQKNIRYGATITDIKVDLNTIPISGKISGVQTGYRARGSVSRNIEVTFTLYDVARSQKNVHGCKIDQWNVRYTSGNNDLTKEDGIE